MPGFISNTIQAHIASYFGSEIKFLLLKRAVNLRLYPNIWQVVTGTIESGETALQCAEREIFEETGLTALEMWTIPYITHFFDLNKDIIHASPVFGILVDKDSPVILSDEHQDYEWLNLEDAKSKMILPTHIEGMRIFNEFILLPLEQDYTVNYCVPNSLRSKL